MAAELLVDAFAICGISSGEPLFTVNGEAGFLGTDGLRYRPSIVDSLARSQSDSNERGAKLPTHFAMVQSSVNHAPNCLQALTHLDDAHARST